MENPEEVNINDLIKDRDRFWRFVYTPAEEAAKELERRWKDPSIKSPPYTPDILKNGPATIAYVSLITPNYQIRRHMHITDLLSLKPIIFEQTKDKFTSNNEWKRSLGKLHLNQGLNKNGKARVEHLNIIDFNKYNGKTIDSIKTFWGQRLIDFHHEYFLKTFPNLSLEDNFFDASDWFRHNGDSPRRYYRAFLSLLIKNAIEFENFMLDEKEIEFTRDVFLPAFIEVYKLTGLKPLIVALEPTETEGDEFWISYPYEDKKWIDYKRSNIFKKMWMKIGTH